MFAKRPFHVACLIVALATFGSYRAEAQLPVYQFSWGTFGTGPGQFNEPYCVAVDALGNVYVADQFNYRIQKFTADGTYLASWGHQGSGPGEFAMVIGLTLHPDGRVYVSDTGNNRIQVFTSDGQYLMQWGTQGNGPGQFNLQRGLTIDAGGLLHVADHNNNRMQTFTDQGQLVGVWASGELASPADVALDAGGNFYITEEDGNRISKYGPDRVRIASFGTAGTEPGQLNGPIGIAVDDLGHVFVACHINGEIDVFGLDGTLIGVISGGLTAPEDVAIGESGQLYVVNQGNHRIDVYGHPAVAAKWSTWGAMKSRYRGERGAAQSATPDR